MVSFTTTNDMIIIMIHLSLFLLITTTHTIHTIYPVAVVSAFQHNTNIIPKRRQQQLQYRHPFVLKKKIVIPQHFHHRSSSSLFGILDDLRDFLFSKPKAPPQPIPSTPSSKTTTSTTTKGTITRIASKPYQPDGSSKPSSRTYTTRKESYPKAQLSKHGIVGDYNHYRTIALDNTLDRAVSILTEDVLDICKNSVYGEIQDGDLGENLCLDGFKYDSFQIGSRCCIGHQDGIILEITEPIVACANLCKLQFINRESSSPKERIQKCTEFIDFLNQKDGLRGWYAKVVDLGKDDGFICVGDEVKLM
uniref:MOSC domain-containing protein n=1 Tax=Ditylum brightwellii TaxID=49249 RepID=A0A7S2A1V4_9STRA